VQKRLWLVCGLVYDPRGLPGVTTVRPGVVGVLQMVSELTLMVSRARTDQLRSIRWHTGPLGGTQYGTYGASWTYGTHIPVLEVRTWPRGDVPGLGLTDEDVGLLRGWIVTSWLKA
jgi:hypothetical protein